MTKVNKLRLQQKNENLLADLQTGMTSAQITKWYHIATPALTIQKFRRQGYNITSETVVAANGRKMIVYTHNVSKKSKTA